MLWIEWAIKQRRVLNIGRMDKYKRVVTPSVGARKYRLRRANIGGLFLSFGAVGELILHSLALL